ncbi:MAG: hypothetical protein VYC34_07170 [Planctomycetota bacterium]|nr:hypothetical protein [Planctomycetota bacterium]
MDQYSEGPGEFEMPPDGFDGNDGGGGGEFEAPDFEGGDGSEGGAGDGGEKSGELRAALEAVTQHLMSQAARISEIGTRSIEDLEGEGNIVGAAIVGGPIDDMLVPPGEEALAVFTVEEPDIEMVRRTLSDSFGVRAAAEDSAPIIAIRTGEIDAYSHRFKIRPAPGGVSVGHYRITAGTLGCLARDARRLYILSNNHVLANSNNARVGDPILQPGPADGGRNPGAVIAKLQKWVTINFAGGVNYVDCAIGWTDPRLVRRELVYLHRGTRRFFRVSTGMAPARVGQLVGKTGRTTQLTCGRVTSVNATIRVNFGGGRVAVFADQMAIKSVNSQPFSAGGDSGSLIWTWDARRNPVGLLFAGGGGITFANKIQRVLPALGVQLYT